jgi:hypothetical protein
MKKIILLIAFVFFITDLSFAQAIKLPTNRKGEVEFKETVKADGATADHLFTQAHQFFKETYPDPRDIIDVDDKDSGKITGFGVIDGGNNYRITYSIEINVSNGSYDYNFTPMDYTLRQNGSVYSSKKEPFTADQPNDIDDKKWAVFTTNTFTTLSLLSNQLKTIMAK